MAKLFVYGTLRKGGEANSLLGNSLLVEQDVKLDHFSLYNYYNQFPIAVWSLHSNDFIVGDIYIVAASLLQTLDRYEGEMFKRVFHEEKQFFIYVIEDNVIINFPKIFSGNWFIKT